MRDHLHREILRGNAAEVRASVEQKKREAAEAMATRLMEAAQTLLSAVDAYAATPEQSAAQFVASLDVEIAAECVRATLAEIGGGNG